jgi:flagellar basal body-associated protein FliL
MEFGEIARELKKGDGDDENQQILVIVLASVVGTLILGLLIYGYWTMSKRTKKEATRPTEDYASFGEQSTRSEG